MTTSLNDFNNSIQDALEYIELALYTTENLAASYDGEWSELNDVIDQIDSIKDLWEQLITDPIRLAIQAEQETN